MKGTARALLALLPALAAGGCAALDWSKEPLAVSVSAANYSELPPGEVFARVNAPAGDHPPPPAVATPDRPLFYGFVPGEVYASDVPLETVYRELSVQLAHRGYFNVLYEAQAGYLPKRVDYLLRVHFGERLWRTPTVRTDTVTWGNSGLVSSFHGDHPFEGRLLGPGAQQDSRSGQDPMEALSVATYMQTQEPFVSQAQGQYTEDTLSDHGATRDTALVVVEAFRFDDVRTMGGRAPCVWAAFVAVPLHPGQTFSGVLPALARTAMPYFGGTTDGVQTQAVPPGTVTVGEPVVVPAAPRPQTP